MQTRSRSGRNVAVLNSYKAFGIVFIKCRRCFTVCILICIFIHQDIISEIYFFGAMKWGDIYLFTYLFICLFINLFFFRFLGIHLYIHIAGVLDFYFMSYTLLSLIVSMFPLRTSMVLLSAFRSK